MAVTYGARSVTSGTDATAEGALPASPSAGDIHIAFVLHASSSATITTPASGWTELTTISPTDFSAHAYYRLWQSGDTTTPTWTWSSGGWVVEIVRYGGVDTTTPVNIDLATKTTGTANTITLGSITPTVNDCMIVGFANADASGSGRTYTQSGAMTERLDEVTSTHWHAVADEQLSGGSGTPVSRDFTIAGTAQDLAGWLIALAPATGGGTTHQLASTGSGTTTGSAALTGTLAVASTGTGTTTGSAALTGTLALSASGSGATSGSAALTSTLQLSATGSGITGGSAAIDIVGTSTTHQLTATGSGTSGGSAALGLIGALSASGTGLTGGSASLTLQGSLSASGASQSGGSVDLTFVTFTFSPPTHEEPMWTNKRPLNYYRITESSSIVRVNGVLTTIRHPRPDQIAAAGVEGVDYFLGGREYVVTGGVLAELISAGY